MPVSRRVSYILPAPSEPPPVLQLPGIGERRRGVTQPYLVHKETGPNAAATNGTAAPIPANPFTDTVKQTNPNSSSHPRHCLGVNALALDTSTVLTDASAPGGILYSGGRDGLVVSWDLGIPHKRRRGQRYQVSAGTGRTNWDRVGDGAEIWDDDDDEDGFNETPPDDAGTGTGNGAAGETDGWSSDDDLGDGWVGVDGDKARKRAARGEVPYEDRWEVDYDAAQDSVSRATALCTTRNRQLIRWVTGGANDI